MKLVFKINLIVVIASIFGSAAMILMVATLSRSLIETSIGDRQLDQSTTILNHLDEELSERQRDIKTISQDRFISDSMASGEISSIDMENELNRFVGNGESWWNGILVTNKDGKIVAAVKNAKLLNENLENDTEVKKGFLRAISGNLYISDAVKLSSSNSPTMIFAAPIYDAAQANKILGAAIGELSWNELLQIIESESGILIHLYKNDGTVIGANDKAHQSGIFNSNHSDAKIFKDIVKNGSASSVSKSVHGDFDSLSTGLIEKGYDGFSGNKWILLSETPTSIAFAPITKTTIQLAEAILLLTLGIVLVVIFAVRFFILRPISNLFNAATAFSGGDLDYRITIKSKDEFGELSKLFNDMASKLKESYSNLQSKIDDKTKEINFKLKEVQKANLDLENARKAIVNIAEDISLEKEELNEIKVKDDAILDSIGEGMFVADTSGNVILVNKMFELLTGWKSREIMGKKFIDRVPLLDPEGNKIPEEKRPLFITVKTGKPMFVSSEFNYFCIRKNNTKFPISIKTSPVILRGKIIGAVNVFRNVAKEKEIDRMKSEFLSVAAHQLRTPLGSMRWDLEMLLDGDLGKLTSRIKMVTEKIHSRNLHMIDLVNDLLNVSRIDQGRVIDEPKTIDVGALINEAIDDLAHVIKRKSIKLTTKIEKNIKTFIDPKKFHQVAENLIANSINYSHKGGKVDVVLRREEAYIKIDVKDSGIGIPEADKDHIFTKFFRAENAVKSETEGTGLGLFVVKSYVEKWKGKVWFESKVGRGTTFHIKIPLVKEKIKK